jgi:hypothetical protein
LPPFLVRKEQMRTKQEEKKVREEKKNRLCFKSCDGPGEGGRAAPRFSYYGSKKTGAKPTIICILEYSVKKASDFPSPAGMSLTKVSLAVNNLIIHSKGKSLTFFYSVEQRDYFIKYGSTSMMRNDYYYITYKIYYTGMPMYEYVEYKGPANADRICNCTSAEVKVREVRTQHAMCAEFDHQGMFLASAHTCFFCTVPLETLALCPILLYLSLIIRGCS